MKIFVTGGTGFVGSHFLNQAMQAGHEVIALRRTKQSKPRIALVAEPQWVDAAMEDLRVDHFQGCAVLVHLAAHSANVPYDTLENCIRWNVTAPLKMCAVAARAGIRKFIMAGSCFEYGRSAERYDFIPSDAPLEPVLSYPTSKAMASVAFHGFACEQDAQLLILRIFQVYGEGELASRMWPSLRQAAMRGEDFPMTKGEQVRDFIPVEQIAAAFIAAIDRNDLVSGEPRIENLGSGRPQTLLSFAEQWWQIWKATGKLLPGVVPYRPNEIMRFVPQVHNVCKPDLNTGRESRSEI